MRIRTLKTLVAVTLVAAFCCPEDADAKRKKRKKGRRGAASSTNTGIVRHPDQLVYPPLTYQAPDRSQYRHELNNGIPVYVVTDGSLPLIDIAITARGGDYLDPPGKEGLAGITCNQMRDGGAGDMDPKTYDEEIDFLAVSVGVGSGNRESTASLNVLSKDLDAGLDLLFDALRRPRFDAERLALYKKRRHQRLERRNDSTPGIERREWQRLIYGDDHFESAQVTKGSLDSISRQDMIDFHQRLWHPGNLIIAVSGDVEPSRILPALEQRMAGWNVGAPLPAVPAPPSESPTGVFVVNKEDVNQTRVRMGHRSVTWDHPDARAIQVMNDILGGGGFTSRITKRVRSDEGLAYSAGSGYGFGRDYPRTFVAVFQSKNESVAHALTILGEEIRRIQAEPVSEEELTTSINGFVDSFPSNFSSAGAKAGTFVSDEIRGRPLDYWKTYRDKLRAVTAADVQRVAQQHLHPDKVTVLVVGKVDEVMAGDPDKPEYQLENIAGPNGIMEIALPEPATLAYPHPPRPLVGKPQVEGMGS